MLEQHVDVPVGQVRDVVEIAGSSTAKQLSRRVAMDQFEHPAHGNVLDEQGKFGKAEREEVVELIDQPRALPHDGLQSASNLAQRSQLGRQGRRVRRSFADGKARGGLRLDGIGLFVAEERGPIVLVALRIAAGDTDGDVSEPARASAQGTESVQKVQQVVGILPRRIEPDDEVAGAVTLGNLRQRLAQAGVAPGRLCKLQLGRRRLQVVAQEGRTVPIARRVDADANTARLAGGR